MPLVDEYKGDTEDYIDSNGDTYPSYGSRPQGVKCQRCGLTSSGGGLTGPTWISYPDDPDDEVDVNAPCYSTEGNP